MFADINHFVHISHHLPSYVTLTRLGNTINNVNDELSELKAPQESKIEMNLFSGQDLNFSELFSFNDEKSGWTSEYGNRPNSPGASADRDSPNFSEVRLSDRFSNSIDMQF
jgi:hypothetical protein